MKTNSETPDLCWCGSGMAPARCCAPLLTGAAPAATAEALMRSRYSAYVTGNERYLRDTWYPVTCPPDLSLDVNQRWLGLKVLDSRDGGEADDQGTVEFVARYKIDGRGHRLHEVSHFEKIAGRWLYVGGEVNRR